MPKPADYLTAFSFKCNSLKELPIEMEKQVGYEVKPQDIWSLNIEPFELSKLRVVLTIIYWKDKTKEVP